MASTKLYDGKMNTVTVNAMRLASALIMGADVKYPQKSTINEALNFMTSQQPAGTDRPHLQYMCIGNKGHTAVETDGIYDFIPYGKKASYSGLFNFMPFVLRTLDNDLTDAQRENYAGRIIKEYNGRQYVGYWVRKLDTRAVETTDLDIYRDEDGNEQIVPFVYTDNELFPTPGVLPDYDYDNDGTVELPSGRLVESGADLQISWTDFDVQEYMNVCEIIRGTSSSSVVSEIALCSGIPAAATAESSTGSKFSYEEAIGLQALYFIDLFVNLAITNDDLALNIRIGQTVPFWLGPN